MTPREEDADSYGRSAELIKRAKGCHVNAFESFAPFAAAIVICRLQKANPLDVFRLGSRYLFARLLFTIFYLAGINPAVSTLRSFAWFDSVRSIINLYRLALKPG